MSDSKLPLPELDKSAAAAPPVDPNMLAPDDDGANRGAADLEAVYDVPVQVSAVLGRARMEVGDLLRIGPGTVLELDRKVGEAIDIYVNNRLVARGEVVLVEDKLGVTMTEVIKAEQNQRRTLHRSFPRKREPRSGECSEYGPGSPLTRGRTEQQTGSS